MKTPCSAAAYKCSVVLTAILVLLQSCALKTQAPEEASSPTPLTASATATYIPEPTETSAPPPTPTALPRLSPVEYNLPPQFIARLNFGEIEKFSVSPQQDLLVVGSASHICLYSTPSFTLLWCTLTVPAIGMLTPDDASCCEKISRMVFRQDGGQLAVSLWNGYILILDTSDGDLIHAVNTGRAGISGVGWSPDGKQVMVYRSKDSIELWEASTGKFSRQLDIDAQAFNHLEWSQDASLFATTEYTGTIITIWDSFRLLPTATIEIQSAGFVSSMAFSPDLQKLYVGIATPFPCEQDCDSSDPGYKGWITVYTVEDGSLVGKTDVGDAISRLAVSPDGKLIAGGGGIFGSFVVLDEDTGRILVKQADTRAYSGVAWLDNNRAAYLPGQAHVDAKSLSQWDVRWSEHSEIYLPGYENIQSLAWLPDGKQLITNTAGGMITLWQAHTGQQLEQFQLMVGGKPVVRFEPGWISPVEPRLAVEADNSIAIIDLASHQVVKWLNHADIAETILATDLVWSRDGQKLMAGLVDKEHPGRVAVAIWEVRSGKRLLTIPVDYDMEIHKMAFSPDGEQIVLGRTYRVGEFEHQLVTMDIQTAQVLQKLVLETDTMKVVWVAPGQIAFENCSKTHIWNLADGSQREIPGATAYPTIRSDGSLVASPCFGVGISLWELQNGRELVCLEIPAERFGYKSLSFSPDGSLLASLSDNGSVLLWDTSEFKNP